MWCCLPLPAQEESAGKKKNSVTLTSNVPVPLNVARRTLTNFLTDRIALEPYKGSGDSPRPFRAAFVIDSPRSDFAVIWHPESCRIVGVVNLNPMPAEPIKQDQKSNEEKSVKADTEKEEDKDEEGAPPSPYVLIASGLPPLAATMGEQVSPSYFGFRMIGDRPEFLYSIGNLTIEETIWLDASGEKMMQRMRIGNREDSDLKLSFPEDWKKRIDTATGTWKGSILTIPKEDADEFVLTYRLSDKKKANNPTDKD